jgi:hypothetical protein
MRLMLVLSWLVALAAAGPAEARCRVVMQSGDFRLGKGAEGWELCGRGYAFEGRGRPVAINSRGEAVSVRFRDGRRTIVRWVDYSRGGPNSSEVVLESGRPYVKQAFVPGELYVTVGGRRPEIQRASGEDFNPADDTRGIRPRSLRARGDVVEWRVGTELRQVRNDRDIPPADCRVPSYAAEVRRAGDVVAYELRIGAMIHYGTAYACLAGGRPQAVAETSNDLAINEARPQLLGGPFAVYELKFAWKEVFRSLRVVDLRSGGRTAETGLAGVFMQAVVSPSGALAIGERVDDRQQIRLVRGEAEQVLDSGPGVDGGSLAVAGSTLTWRTGGETRSAPFE